MFRTIPMANFKESLIFYVCVLENLWVKDIINVLKLRKLVGVDDIQLQPFDESIIDILCFNG